jgi:acyl-CoA thioester hydrolase
MSLHPPTSTEPEKSISSNPKAYRHRVEHSVRYDDLDTYHHVNNKVFLSYIEDARVQYFDELVPELHSSKATTGIVIARSEINYLHSIHYGDRVYVYTKCIRIGTKSLEFHSIIVTNKTGREQVCAESRSIMVTIDLATGKSTPNLPELCRAIKTYEGL